MAIVKLYHGTDIESALDILNNGLNGDRLLALQTQPVQLGKGWYAALYRLFCTCCAKMLVKC